MTDDKPDTSAVYQLQPFGYLRAELPELDDPTRACEFYPVRLELSRDLDDLEAAVFDRVVQPQFTQMEGTLITIERGDALLVHNTTAEIIQANIDGLVQFASRVLDAAQQEQRLREAAANHFRAVQGKLADIAFPEP